MGAVELTSFIHSSPTIKVEAISKVSTTTANQVIELPAVPVEVATYMVTIEPGATLPVHRHAFPRFGYVISGSLEVNNLETGETNVFEQGKFIVEAILQWHTGSNPGCFPLKLLVIDQVPIGKENTEIQKAPQ